MVSSGASFTSGSSRSDCSSGVSTPLCCYCHPSVERISWTDRNPLRRFRNCSFYGVHRCGYFQWVDPEMCERSKQVIPEMRRKLIAQEKRIKSLLSNSESDRRDFQEHIRILETLREKVPTQEIEISAYNARLRGQRMWNQILLWVVVTIVIAFATQVFFITPTLAIPTNQLGHPVMAPIPVFYTADWTLEMSTLFLRELHNQANKENFSPEGDNQTGIVAAMAMVNGMYGTRLSFAFGCDVVAKYSRCYNVFTRLINRKEVKYNWQTNHVLAPDYVWDSAAMEDKLALAYLLKGDEDYQLLRFLFAPIVARKGKKHDCDVIEISSDEDSVSQKVAIENLRGVEMDVHTGHFSIPKDSNWMNSHVQQDNISTPCSHSPYLGPCDVLSVCRGWGHFRLVHLGHRTLCPPRATSSSDSFSPAKLTSPVNQK